MGKVYTRFQTNTAQKPYPLGAAHNYMAYKRGNPLPPAPRWGQWHMKGVCLRTVQPSRQNLFKRQRTVDFRYLKLCVSIISLKYQ